MELTEKQKLDVLKRELKLARRMELDRFVFFNKTKGKIACEHWLERKYISEVLKEKVDFMEKVEKVKEWHERRKFKKGV